MKSLKINPLRFFKRNHVFLELAPEFLGQLNIFIWTLFVSEVSAHGPPFQADTASVLSHTKDRENFHERKDSKTE